MANTKDVKFSGFSAIPSDYESADGELALSLNLLNESGGGLSSIEQPYVEMTLPDEERNCRIVFIHETTAFAHYILLDERSGKLAWKNKGSGLSTDLGYFHDFLHCNAVGNTLIVFSDSEMRYFLWEDTKYTDLGNQLPKIYVSFGLVGHPRLYSQSYSKFTVSFAESMSVEEAYGTLSDANQTRVTEQVMAKVNKFIKEQTTDKGRFCFPFFVRYALRLYDDSLVCHSSPILMNPQTRPAPLVTWDNLKGKKDKLSEAQNCDIMLVASSLDYQVSHEGDYYDLAKWKDLIKSIDVFISKPIYTYDQEGKISSFRDTDNFETKFIGKLYHQKYHRGGSADFPTSVSEDNILGPIDTVNGTTDFLNHYMEWEYSRIYEMYFSPERTYPSVTLNLPEFTDGKISESIQNCSTFYKLHSITLSDAAATARTEIPIEDDYLQSLVAREVMTDDYLTNDRLLASTSQAYNSRLNLSGVKRKLFSGFPAWSMFAFCDSSFSWAHNASNKKSLIIQTNELPDTVRIAVFIKEGGKTFSVQTSSGGLAHYLSPKQYSSDEDEKNDTNWTRRKLSYGCYLFYPNANAFKMVISSLAGGTSGGGSMVIDLKPHDFLNGAFALLDYDIQRLHNYSSDMVPNVTAASYEYVDCGNKVYTSEVNNPFFFPLSGINTVGTGKILGISTAAKALSQGQFGQFPLYAFSEDGVWAMEVTETGSYRAKQPITRDVCINPEGITQIDSSVLFPTDRGIMLISGSQTQCISDSINDEVFNVLNLPGFDKLHSMLGHGADSCIPIRDFSSFIRECKMIYDYVHQRIIVYNRNYSYAYVYSLKTKLWGMMYSNIRDNVNSYPEALAVTSDGKLVNLCKTAVDTHGNPLEVKSLLVTRPLKLDAPDVHKTIDTIIQRGHFRKGNVQSVLYGSRDLEHWHLVWSSKDHFLRGFRGTPYKYFRIALLCNLAPDESIFGASVQFTPRLTNQPR